MIQGLSAELVNKYMNMSQEEFEELNTHEVKTIPRRIRELIAEYNTFKCLLAEEEYKLEQIHIHYDTFFMTLKEEYMNGEKGKYKSTEAKEHAKSDLRDSAFKIAEVERSINLLKANIHSVEYQLRLKYLQLEQKEEIKRIMEEPV